MDALVLLIVGVAALAAGLTSPRLRLLVPGAAAFLAGLGIIRATFAAMTAEPAPVAAWVAVALVGAGVFTASMMRAGRRQRGGTARAVEA